MAKRVDMACLDGRSFDLYWFLKFSTFHLSAGVNVAQNMGRKS